MNNLYYLNTFTDYFVRIDFQAIEKWKSVFLWMLVVLKILLQEKLASIREFVIFS